MCRGKEGEVGAMLIDVVPQNSCTFCIIKICPIIMKKGRLFRGGRKLFLSSRVSQVGICIAGHVCSRKYLNRKTQLVKDLFSLKCG